MEVYTGRPPGELGFRVQSSGAAVGRRGLGVHEVGLFLLASSENKAPKAYELNCYGNKSAALNYSGVYKGIVLEPNGWTGG